LCRIGKAGVCPIGPRTLLVANSETAQSRADRRRLANRETAGIAPGLSGWDVRLFAQTLRATLLDEGMYLCSTRTMFRILAAATVACANGAMC
jgi:hypothetical protein